ncbi:MAG: hypothetical protein LC667_18950, partial [Thioalkalivibrio sp.]|nr:hypothetical protein [Thioalkalivibrio sp.]
MFEVRPAGIRAQFSPVGGVRWRSDAYRGHATRGRITEFSPRSRSRLRLAAFDLGEFHQPDLLLTLTYPGEWRSVAPDGPASMR